MGWEKTYPEIIKYHELNIKEYSLIRVQACETDGNWLHIRMCYQASTEENGRVLGYLNKD